MCWPVDNEWHDCPGQSSANHLGRRRDNPAALSFQTAIANEIEAEYKAHSDPSTATIAIVLRTCNRFRGRIQNYFETIRNCPVPMDRPITSSHAGRGHPLPIIVEAPSWDKIGPMFELLYSSSGYNLPQDQTSSLLEIMFGFQATPGQYQYQIRRQPWLRKNKSISAEAPTTTVSGESSRHRPKKSPHAHSPCPRFLALRSHLCIPQPLEPLKYKNQMSLLLSTDKYVKGCLDGSPSGVGVPDVGNQLTRIESKWQQLLNSCQGMLALIRKGKHFVRSEASQGGSTSKKLKDKAKFQETKTVIERILVERVLCRLGDMTKLCSPSALGHIWSICLILMDLSFQLGYARGAFVARFLRSLHYSLSLDVQSTHQSTHIGFADVIKHLEYYFVDDSWDTNKYSDNHNRTRDDNRQEANAQANDQQSRWIVDGTQNRRHARETQKEKRQQHIKESQACHSETKHIIRTSYQCAARAFSTRLKPNDPNVLRIWADYCRQWDVSALKIEEFLKDYQEAFRETEMSYGPDHDYTIDVLCNYAAAAYYICHAKDLARTLATELWKRTHDVCYGQSPTWSTRTRAMAEAARILGLSLCIYHENMHKNSDTRRQMRKQLGLRKKKNRQRWRLTLGPPPPSHLAREALFPLNQAVQYLATGNWDCCIAAHDMSCSLRVLLLTFCGPRELYKEVGVGILERGNECLARVFDEADPVPGTTHMPLSIRETTIDPNQLPLSLSHE
ncbi:hypothetical protein BKA64DRAFT_356117 [Cadophora sp. MPI-SDFR-AT-0126]|nr:hypothetical protein BKA64DRAFT_356117 [Leotiomycetes sp. MPI-SDFR-AT-0126]